MPLVLALAGTLGACADEPYHRGLGVFVDVTSCEPYCNFDQMVRGGTASLRLTPVSDEQLDLTGARLVSNAPAIVAVASGPARATEMTADVAALEVGATTLSVVDADGHVVEEIPIVVRAANRLGLGVESPNGDILGMEPPAGFAEQFKVRTGTDLLVHVDPYDTDLFLMGVFGLAVTVDESAVPPAQWLPPLDAATLAKGTILVHVTEGDHDLVVDAPGLGVSPVRVRLTGAACAEPVCRPTP